MLFLFNHESINPRRATHRQRIKPAPPKRNAFISVLQEMCIAFASMFK